MSLPFFFGVRHLSPNTSGHLLRTLAQRKPRCILLETPQDMLDTLLQCLHPDVRLPVAVMAYTQDLPVSSILYPLAEYSPEYQTIQWAKQHTVEVRAIDLPASVSLQKNQARIRASLALQESMSDEETADEETVEEAETDRAQLAKEMLALEIDQQTDVYESIALEFGESSYDDYWERYFETESCTEDFICHFRTLIEQVRSHHALTQYSALEPERELERESCMLHAIRKALEQYAAEDIFIVVGAYHVPALEAALQETAEWLPLTLEQIELLPRTAIKQVLMPYSYQRLSQQSGYGAGNRAPYYYHIRWQGRDHPEDAIAVRYISLVSDTLRAQGIAVSSAQAIDAVELAQALAIFKGRPYVVLTDLQDAIETCMGHGSELKVREAIALVNHSRQIGFVPQGMGQTPLQEDFYRQLTSLKLESYKIAEAQTIKLDIRENRQVKSREIAWRDFDRSVFFQRLRLLNIPFAALTGTSNNLWTEVWQLLWTPDSEIVLVETSLQGESIEYVANSLLSERLREAQAEGERGIQIVAQVIESACLARLPLVFSDALSCLQAMTAESIGFASAVSVMQVLSNLIQYGSLRRMDTVHFPALLEQLFIRTSLIALEAAHGDNDYAQQMRVSFSNLEAIAQRHAEILPLNMWQEALWHIVEDDSTHPLLSGLAAAILLENNLLTDERLDRELNVRLHFSTSSGTVAIDRLPIELAALWFEGFASRNRYALLAKPSIWHILDRAIEHIPEEVFPYALVVFRRTFSTFDVRSVQKLSTLLADFWHDDAEEVGHALHKPLNEQEQQQLQDLNDFDFDF